jgi:hypothetical protein
MINNNFFRQQRQKIQFNVEVVQLCNKQILSCNLEWYIKLVVNTRNWKILMKLSNFRLFLFIITIFFLKIGKIIKFEKQIQWNNIISIYRD